MAWLRIDDGFAQHPKIVALTPKDRWTWVEILCYCARYQTQGEIPDGIHKVVKGATEAFIERACDVGLIDFSHQNESESDQKTVRSVHDWVLYNGDTIESKVDAFLNKNPSATANEVHRAIGGKRELVLKIVHAHQYPSGSLEPQGNQYPGTGSGGSPAGTQSVPLARAREPVPSPTSLGEEGSPVDVLPSPNRELRPPARKYTEAEIQASFELSRQRVAESRAETERDGFQTIGTTTRDQLAQLEEHA
jgi:hypothetical protein